MDADERRANDAVLLDAEIKQALTLFTTIFYRWQRMHEHIPTIAEIDATPNLREERRRRRDAMWGIRPRTTQETGNSDSNKSQPAIPPTVKSPA
jgi:hypothetical protein